MAGIEQELGKQLNKIDTNKINWLEREEIDNFLLNEKKVQKLWNTMQENFETQSEKLQEYKENVWKICERILENENINLNQWKILLFYLKHFHNENAGVWRDIIKSVIEWKGWNRYQEVVSNMSSKKISKHENTWNDEERQKIDERFNNLPWTKEIKEEWERAQNLKKCDWILLSQDRLTQEDIQWLQWYKTTSGLDSELVGRIETRLDLEKCYQLLGAEELTVGDVKWLWEYKDNWNIDSEMQVSIEEKIDSENLKICNKLLASPELSQEEAQRLQEYKNTEGQSPDIVNRITVKFSEEILKNNESLTSESIQILQECVDKNIWELEKIKDRLKLEEKRKEIADNTVEEIEGNPLRNLEMLGIAKESKLTRENRINLVNNIKTFEDVAKITEENIATYLPAAENVSKENIPCVVYNFQKIIGKHLCLHEWYKLGYWLKPASFATGYWNLESIVNENSMLEFALKELEKLKATKKVRGKNGKRMVDVPAMELSQKIDYVLWQKDNHILFDFWLKTELSSCRTNEQKANVISTIFSNNKYKNKIRSFAWQNTYIAQIQSQYQEAIAKAEAEKKRVEDDNIKYEEVNRLLSWSKINLPWNIRNTFAYGDIHNGRRSYPTDITILSREKISRFEKDGTLAKMRNGRKISKSYDYFCNIYEASKKFYENVKKEGWIAEQLQLPNCLNAQDYIDFLSTLRTMEDDISKVKKEHAAFRRGWWGTIWYTWFVDAWAASYYSGKQVACNVKAARKFVELWKKSTGPRRPDNFMWIKLDRSCGPKTDDIIRDSTLEWIVDKVKGIWRNLISWCWQQLFWDIVWLAAGVTAWVLTTAYTWSPALGWAAFYLADKVGNWVAQAWWDLIVDQGLWRWLGLWEESWGNRVDGVRNSFLCWIWKDKRDNESGLIVENCSWGERAIDTSLWTALSAITFEAVGGLKWILEHPFKYAAISEFWWGAGNCLGAATKSAFGTENFEWISIGDAFTRQFHEEFQWKWLREKVVSVFLVTATVNWCNGAFKRIKDGGMGQKLAEQVKKISSFLERNGVKDLQQLSSDTALSGIFKEEFNSLLFETEQLLPKAVATIGTLAILYKERLLSPDLPPRQVLKIQREKATSGLRNAETLGNTRDMATYTQVLARLNELERYINEEFQVSNWEIS